MPNMHANQHAATDQKRQKIAQIQLVVDAGHQQHQQGHHHHPTGFGGQDVDIALVQQHAVGQRQSGFKPLLKAFAEKAHLKLQIYDLRQSYGV